MYVWFIVKMCLYFMIACFISDCVLRISLLYAIASIITVIIVIIIFDIDNSYIIIVIE